ncbi:aspartate/ornithine carbamoyltransferase family protein [Roseiconus lacunae]|uniref:Aspartate carbamoyltransferase n=1 Tax=Roseiconus lacunae TaxID=2605694 RepID=A0ABT7PQU2_9BACT|nr:aspartate carbamoyltransferase [Roseiconus lacunae]MCD0462989.1 aspartate carbamoyltransferase [Roseiconus lacunae]MDM4018481.1 aspartate carbamoyltransferase [Roseiconus lacunae]WRQ49098.1 aspartate carbamoyltransferase [Stieleria sp. HD01]
MTAASHPEKPLTNYATNSKGLSVKPSDLLDFCNHQIDREALAALAGQSILNPRQFDRRTVVALSQLAALLELRNVEIDKPLDGKIAITAFFEASTRTRLSFESAVLRLDGKVLSVPDGQVTGIAKGESLADIGEMFNTYGDVVIMRHPDTNSIDEIRKNLQRPLINAGNGSGHHPTQALIDWYALLKWRPELVSPDCPEDRRIHLGIIGTPGSMRAVKSFLRISLMFAGAVRKITLISEMADPVGLDLTEPIEQSPIELEITNDVQEVIPELDVAYVNSIAFLGDSYRNLGSRYKIDCNSRLKPHAVVMHPLARNKELSTDLDDTIHNLYFAQAAGAVFVRQALLTAVLDRLDRVSGI